MISFRIKSDPADDGPADKLLSNLRVFTLAESLGGVESLIELPSKMTHGSVALEDRIKIGIGHNLIRVSVGIEDTADLIQDLERYQGCWPLSTSHHRGALIQSAPDLDSDMISIQLSHRSLSKPKRGPLFLSVFISIDGRYSVLYFSLATSYSDR